MFLKDYSEVAHLVEAATAHTADDAAAAVFGAALSSVARSAEMLARTYVLVATNPPYLAAGRQVEGIRQFASARYPASKGDLATMFIERCWRMTAENGAYAMVTPQNWLFLGTYRLLRKRCWRIRPFAR